MQIRNVPLVAGSPTPAPAFGPEINGGFSIGDVDVRGNAFDRLPGDFGGVVDAVGQVTMPDFAFGHNWFPCAICRPTTAQNQPLATQARIAPQNGPSVLPAQATLFSTVVSLTGLAPANWAANFALNSTSDGETTGHSALVGAAQGYNASTATSFADTYLTYQSPTGDPYVFSFAAAEANHMAAGAAFKHTSDAIGTAVYGATIGRAGLSATVQYGSQAVQDGQTTNAIASYTIGHTDSLKMNPWDLLLGGSGAASDISVAGAYVARGINFQPPDAGPDALPGLHGFAGEVALYPSNPFKIGYFADRNNVPYLDHFDGTGPAGKAKDEPPMKIDLSGWSFGDVVPRYQNLAASATVLLTKWLSANAKASRGFIATSAASGGFASSPVLDPAGMVPIPQSAASFQLGSGGGDYRTLSDENDEQSGLKDPKLWTFPGTRWSAAVGYANATKAACNPTALGADCHPSHYQQVTATFTVDGSDGFLSGTLGPANLPSGLQNTSQNPDAAAGGSQFGGFINKNTWNVQAGLHVPTSLKSGLCNSIVLNAGNTAQAPDIANAAPGATLNIGAFAEIVPLRSWTPLAALFGFVHTIQNAATPSFATPASFGSQFVSTVTYAFKLALGSEAYRNQLRSSCVLAKPVPTPTPGAAPSS